MATLHSASCRYEVGDQVYVNYKKPDDEYAYLVAGEIVSADLHIKSSVVDGKVVDEMFCAIYRVKLKCFPDVEPKSYMESDVFQFDRFATIGDEK